MGTFKNHRYEDIEIKDWNNASNLDPLYSLTNPIACHAIYIDRVDTVSIIRCCFLDIKGAAVFVRSCNGLRISQNKLYRNYWYPVNLESDVTNFDVSWNEFRQDFDQGVFWGGAFNVMSNGEPVKHGALTDNEFTGNYSYGGVVRIQSAIDCYVARNRIHHVQLGDHFPQLDVGIIPTLTLIRVTTRVPSVIVNPSHDIVIEDNWLSAPLPNSEYDFRAAIYVSNEAGEERNPATNIRVTGNRIMSPSIEESVEMGIVFHGQYMGIDGIVVKDNYVQYSAKVSTPPGGIGFVAKCNNGAIENVLIGSNTVIDISEQKKAFNINIAIDDYTKNVTNTSPNRLEGGYNQVWINSGAGPGLYFLNDQFFINTKHRSVQENASLDRIADVGLQATTAQLESTLSHVNSQKVAYKRAGVACYNTDTDIMVWATGSEPEDWWENKCCGVVHKPKKPPVNISPIIDGP